MSEERNPWKIRFERERKARKESENLLEKKSLELWNINQDLEKKVNERTESLKNALIKAEKADRAKSDFLANMSHEIRTPLNAIIGFSKYLSTSDNLGEKDLKHASIIESSASSLLSILNDILDFSKIESGNFEISKSPCNILKTCNQVVELFSQKSNEKYISLEYNFDQDIPVHIISDEVRLKQVISNLISNAIKFTTDYGKVKFNLNLINKSETHALLEFEIIDSGIGIPENRIDSILNPFIQLEHISNKHNVGTGLGLSICNNILKLLDSKLEVTSQVGTGSIFKFYLETEISHEIQENTDITLFENNDLIGKILVAEDNVANQELIRLILSDMNFDFEIASNGKEVYEIYKKHPTSYDFILMDINMPVLNGIEAFYLIRDFEEENIIEEIPVIALTANAIKGDKERFLSLGMNDYLSKPINVDELKKVAAKYLDSAQSNSNLEAKVQSSKASNINIQKIVNNIGISENIAQMIVKKFQQEIPKDLNELSQYIDKEERNNIIQKAHYIKNSCLNVALDDACGILEEMESTSLTLQEIKKKFNLLKESLRQI